MKQPIYLILMIFFYGFTAHPMCMSFRYRPIMWNPSGSGAVILKQGFGPEGGGSVELILTHQNLETVRALITSNASPGDNSTPESVTTKACTKNLESLNHNLGVQNFQNTLHKSTCNSDRSYLFTRKLETITPIDDKKRTEVLKQIDYKKEALVYSINQTSFIVVDSESSCKAECFWVELESAKNLYQKKSACLP